MFTVNYKSLQTCRKTLNDSGYSPTGCNGLHGHGNTIWTNKLGESAEITLDKCTGCFVLFCPLHPNHPAATKATLHAIEGIPAITSYVVNHDKKGF